LLNRQNKICFLLDFKYSKNIDKISKMLYNIKYIVNVGLTFGIAASQDVLDFLALAAVPPYAAFFERNGYFYV